MQDSVLVQRVLPSPIVGGLSRTSQQPSRLGDNDDSKEPPSHLCHEYLPERQRPVGESGLHSQRLVHRTELQRHVNADEVVVATQQVQLFAQSIAAPGMCCGPTMQIRTALSDGQVMALYEGSVQRIRVFRSPKDILQLLSRTDEKLTLDTNHTILSSGLDDLTVHAGRAEHPRDHPVVWPEAIGGDEHRCLNICTGNDIAKEPEDVAVASFTQDVGQPYS